MTPARVLIGLAVVAAAGYAVISSTSGAGPKYLGDMPSIMAQASAAPPPVTHVKAGPPVLDPPHFAAHPVVPEAPAAPPRAIAGPAPIGPPAPAINGGGVRGPNGQPDPGSQLTGLLPVDLLAGLPPLPTLDLSKYCVQAGKVIALVPCDQIPPVTVPPITPPGGTPIPGTLP
jgi:hypothetical protein